MQLSIRKWRAKNIDNKIYENALDSNGNLMDYKEFKIEVATEEALREKFLNAKIWDGKSFWEVKKTGLARLKMLFFLTYYRDYIQQTLGRLRKSQ